MLTALKDKFREERAAAEKEELQLGHAHEKLLQELTLMISQGESDQSAPRRYEGPVGYGSKLSQQDIGPLVLVVVSIYPGSIVPILTHTQFSHGRWSFRGHVAIETS